MKNNYILNQIKNRSLKNPNKVALNIYGNQILDFQLLDKYLNQVNNYFLNSKIMSYSRIGLLFDNPLFNTIVGIVCIERANLVFIEGNLDIEIILNETEMFKVDHIFLDEKYVSFAKVFESRNISVSFVSMDNQEFLIESLFEADVLKKDYHNEDIAYLDKTSGTTGNPKIFPIFYDGLINRIEFRNGYYSYTEDYTFLRLTKSNRLSTLIHGCINAFVNGLSIVITDSINPKLFFDVINEIPIDMVNIPTLALVSINEYLVQNPNVYKAKECFDIVLVGSKLNPTIAHSITDKLNVRLYSHYGSKEIDLVSFLNLTEEENDSNYVGKLLNLDTKIIDGEICVKSKFGFRYYENYDNEDIFIDNYFRMGDLGYIKNENKLFINGRSKEMINRGGDKISPYEIEDILLQNKAIKDCAVFPYPNELGYDEVGLVVVLSSEEILNIRDIRKFLLNKVVPFKMPTQLWILDDIPKTSNMKIERKKLYDFLQNDKVVNKNEP